KAAVPVLTAALKEGDANARLQALQALRQLGAEDAETSVPVLAELLKDAQPAVRAQASTLLASLGAEAKPAVPALGELAADPDYGTWPQAINVRRQCGPPASNAAVPALVEPLKNGDATSRQQALQLLQSLAGSADLKPAVPALLELLKEPFGYQAAALFRQI